MKLVLQTTRLLLLHTTRLLQGGKSFIRKPAAIAGPSFEETTNLDPNCSRLLCIKANLMLLSGDERL